MTALVALAALVVIPCSLVACSGASEASPPSTDAGAVAPAPPGTGEGERGDAAAPRPASGCGDGKRSDGELCDGDTVACEGLSALYSPGGTARCRSDCRGYDVTACAATTKTFEMVQPAVREPALWSAAQCNKDGAFPLGVQRGASTKKWVIRLEGGGACSPAAGAPCYERPAPVTSPFFGKKPVTDREIVAGRDLDNVPADFADASYAQLVYCSSDIWTGTQATNAPIPADATGATTMPWRFAGRHNVRAALEILAQRYGLDDGDPETRVFFQGSSAGGHGVLHNVDQVVATMPRTAAGHRVWAQSNAASYFRGWGARDATVAGDWSALDATGTHSGKYWEDVLPALLGSWSADLGAPGCLAAHPADKHVCFFAADVQPYLVEPSPKGLGVPVALANNLEDPNPQDEFGIVGGDAPRAFLPGGALASKEWGDVHAQALASARWVFAPREPLGMHGVPFRVRGQTAPTLQSLMDAFVRQAEPAPFSFIDFAPTTK